MISQAAATDIPIAQPIIPPKIAAVNWIKIVKKNLKCKTIISTYITYPLLYNVHPVYN